MTNQSGSMVGLTALVTDLNTMCLDVIIIITTTIIY